MGNNIDFLAYEYIRTPKIELNVIVIVDQEVSILLNLTIGSVFTLVFEFINMFIKMSLCCSQTRFVKKN